MMHACTREADSCGGFGPAGEAALPPPPPDRETNKVVTARFMATPEAQ